MPPCIILKSDGAALYATTDLATIVDRMENLHADSLIYLADKRQEMHFVQVFRCLLYTSQVELGYNYRMTDFQAALLLSQLDKLDRFIERRTQIVKRYNEAFAECPELVLQREIPESKTARHLYVIQLNPCLLYTSCMLLLTIFWILVIVFLEHFKEKMDGRSA